MTTYITAADRGTHVAIVTAARRAGAQYTSRGARGVLTSTNERRIFLAACVLPSVHHRDHAAHAAACVAWL